MYSRKKKTENPVCIVSLVASIATVGLNDYKARMTTTTRYSLLKQSLLDLPGVISGRLCPERRRGGLPYVLCYDLLLLFPKKMGTLSVREPCLLLIDQEDVDVYLHAYCKSVSPLFVFI
jgi:hypothetical protein